MFILRHLHNDTLVTERSFENKQLGEASKALLELQKAHPRVDGHDIRLVNEPDPDTTGEDRARLLAQE